MILLFIPVLIGTPLSAGCAGQVRFESAAANSPTLSAALFRPEATTPRPALVLLHPCSGLLPFMNDWAHWLQSEGYVALVVDSFSAPGRATNVCRVGRNPTMQEVAADAFGALRFLRAQPFVDPQRVGVMGWSYGGGASLAASRAEYRRLADALVATESKGFQAAVAFYPPCQLAGMDTEIPLLMLLGGADDWTRPERCISVGERLQRDKRPVRWVVYPSALHGFDQPGPPRTSLGHHIAYDGSATADARNQVRQFLADVFR